MQMLCTVRRWLRGLEPRVRSHLAQGVLSRFQPWLEQRSLFRFQRQPLARGVAAGMFCGLIPGPLQLPGTLLACAWLRGNIVAGGVATFYTNPLTTVPLYLLAFQLGALVMPGEQTVPAWSSVAPGGDFSVQALAAWMQALGMPLLVGLPALGSLGGGGVGPCSSTSRTSAMTTASAAASSSCRGSGGNAMAYSVT